MLTRYVSQSFCYGLCIPLFPTHTHIPRGLSDRSLAADYVGSEAACSVYIRICVCTFCHAFAAGSNSTWFQIKSCAHKQNLQYRKYR